ncbi:MAG: D-glycerate dehydrogenase [Peptostreptococcaceae bacterium]|nr:D-glycerate dehydrogenase [Peptostreptococcaceae bacterium]
MEVVSLNKKKKVFSSRKLPGMAMTRLKEQFDFTYNPLDRNLTYEELLEEVKGKQGIITMLSDRVDGELMDAAEGVEIIANYAVGYNNMDLREATKRGIYLSNTPDVLTDDTADMAFALMLAVARRIPEADQLTRNGFYKGWGPEFMLGQSVSGKTLGLVGAGRIGTAVAKRAAGFGMKIIYYSRGRKKAIEDLGAEYVGFESLLAESDIISIHVPLGKETLHLIDRKALKLMKKTCILINTSRGPVVDEEALVEALEKGIIAGAGLDVYENEPKLSDGLSLLTNAVLSPHLGSATRETRGKMADIAAENIISVLSGGLPTTAINEV